MHVIRVALIALSLLTAGHAHAQTWPDRPIRIMVGFTPGSATDITGRITMSFSNVVNVTPLVKEGKLRAFAVSSRKRSALVPELPTMAESGYPGYEAVPWFGLMAPTGTPQPIIDKVHQETVRVLAMPDVRKKLGDFGLDLIGGTPAEFAAYIKAEIAKWAKVIKAAGIKPE